MNDRDSKHEQRRREADAMAALAAETSEPPLWQAFADAINNLLDYGLDPFSELGEHPITVIDAGDRIHGAGIRIAGKQLRWLGYPAGTEHETGHKWIVVDREDPEAGGPDA